MIMAGRSGHPSSAAVGVCAVFLGLVSRSGAELTAKGILLTPQQNGQYVVTEIGDMLRPTAVNIHGHVVGYTETTPYQAFLWKESSGVQLLGAYGADPASIARGINDRGEVVGESFLRPYSLGRAFLWTPSEGMRDLGTLGGTGAAARSINNDGTVAGTSKLSGSDDLQPFAWTESSEWNGWGPSEAKGILM